MVTFYYSQNSILKWLILLISISVSQRQQRRGITDVSDDRGVTHRSRLPRFGPAERALLKVLRPQPLLQPSGGRSSSRKLLNTTSRIQNLNYSYNYLSKTQANVLNRPKLNHN